jgi:hypothetical protein
MANERQGLTSLALGMDYGRPQMRQAHGDMTVLLLLQIDVRRDMESIFGRPQEISRWED